jgi:hypothetical protein
MPNLKSIGDEKLALNGMYAIKMLSPAGLHLLRRHVNYEQTVFHHHLEPSTADPVKIKLGRICYSENLINHTAFRYQLVHCENFGKELKLAIFIHNSTT